MTTAQDEFDELMRDKSRRTRHPDDDDDGERSFLDLSGGEDDDDATPPASDSDTNEPALRPSMNNARIPTTRYQANTGPKGVIADAQNWRDSLHNHRTSVRNSALPAIQAQNLSPENVTELPKDGYLVEEYEDDLHDEEFMRHWRESRIQELQKGSRDSKFLPDGQSRKLYGGFPTVDENGYLDAVDNTPHDTVVVVYVHDDQSDVSEEMAQCLKSLASKHKSTRFVKLHYQDAMIERAGVPAIIAYRGGNSFAQLVPLIDEIPDDADLNAFSLEMVMKRYQVLH